MATKNRLSRSRRLMGVIALASMVLVTPLAGGAAGVFGTATSAANKPVSAATPSAATPPSKSLSVSGGHVAALSPGVSRTTNVLVRNDQAGDVRLVSVTGVVKVSGARALPASCAATNFEVVGFTATASAPGPLLGKKGGTASVPVVVRMTAGAAVQDGCKNLRFAITYTAKGQGK